MKLKKGLSVLLALVMLLLCAVPAFSADSASPAKAKPLTDDDFLTAKGANLVNRRGENVRLKGVNLGAWMIWEDWLNPYEQASDHEEVLSILTERFGEEKAYELMNIYMDNFITDWDLDNIKAMGFKYSTKAAMTVSVSGYSPI